MNVPLLYHWSRYIVTYTQHLFGKWNVVLKDGSKCIVKLKSLRKRVASIRRKAVNY